MWSSSAPVSPGPDLRDAPLVDPTPYRDSRLVNGCALEMSGMM